MRLVFLLISAKSGKDYNQRPKTFQEDVVLCGGIPLSCILAATSLPVESPVLMHGRRPEWQTSPEYQGVGQSRFKLDCEILDK
jgi:hypothetical protein